MLLKKRKDQSRVCLWFNRTLEGESSKRCRSDDCGKVHLPDVIEHLADAQKSLNREINPTVYSTREFGKKFRGNFLKTVLSENKLFLIADESVVRKLGQK